MDIRPYYLGILREDIANKGPQIFFRSVDIGLERLDSVAPLCELVKAFLTTTDDDNGGLGIKIVNGEGKSAT